MAADCTTNACGSETFSSPRSCAPCTLHWAPKYYTDDQIVSWSGKCQASQKSGPSVLLTCVCVWEQEDLWHAQVSDVRSQLRFLEEVESLKKKRKDEEERERLLRLARVS